MAFDELQFLSNIRERPGMFFGEPSLIGLRDLLDGMEWGARIARENAGLPTERLFPIFLDGFLPWYERCCKKDQYSASCWSHMLYVSFSLDGKAFNLCFELFEKYLKQELGLSLPPAEPRLRKQSAATEQQPIDPGPRTADYHENEQSGKR